MSKRSRIVYASDSYFPQPSRDGNKSSLSDPFKWVASIVKKRDGMIARAVKHKMKIQRADDVSSEVLKLNNVIDQLRLKIASMSDAYSTLSTKCHFLETQLAVHCSQKCPTAFAPVSSTYVPVILPPVPPVDCDPPPCIIKLVESFPSDPPSPVPVDAPPPTLVEPSPVPLSPLLKSGVVHSDPVAITPAVSCPQPASPCSSVPFRLPLSEIQAPGPISVHLCSLFSDLGPPDDSVMMKCVPQPASFKDMGNHVSFQYISKSHLIAIIASFQEYGDVCNHLLKFYFPAYRHSYFLVLNVSQVQKDVLIGKYQFIQSCSH